MNFFTESVLFLIVCYGIQSHSMPNRYVFTRWGSKTCPSGTSKLYEGFMASGYYNHRGSGFNTLCMHRDPQRPYGWSSGNQNGNLLYGMEYFNTGAVDKHHGKDAACVVCEHQFASTVYTQWGRSTCSNDHTTVYSGLIMSSKTTEYKSENICVDLERAFHNRSSSSLQNSGRLYTTEMEAGASPEALYPPNFELSCAVCSVRENAVYTRWGSRTCPTGNSILYEGFMATSGAHLRGGGSNMLCMHDVPEFPEGMGYASHSGNSLFGVEYKNTGTLDLNPNKDAACVVCQQHVSASSVYIQWGRQSCSNNHRTEYSGLIMSTYYSTNKGEHVCVDLERAFHPLSENVAHSGGYLYTTEMKAGSSDEFLYPPNFEVSCAVCSSLHQGAVYTRWGSRTCPEGNSKLYEGSMASSNYNHAGGGANTLCMHSSPQHPEGLDYRINNGNYLYGMEYQNTGAIDRNHDGDAACAVCEHNSASNVHNQWGRVTCSNNFRTEYSGLIMSNFYSQYKGESVCVDLARAIHRRSESANHDGGLLYTTEMEPGASDETLYPPNIELACAVCSHDELVLDACSICTGPESIEPEPLP